MRYIFLLLLALGSTSLYAQYPNSVNKMRLGTQTTGDGLIYRHSGVPNWTPTGLVNSWQSIDTTTGNLWAYRSGEWRLEVAGDLQQVYPKVINKSGVNIKRGEVVGVDTSQIIQGDLIRIMRAIGDGGLQSNLIMGVATTDINDNAEGYVVWFGYVREVVEANIAQTGDTLNVGDILYLSSTQPGRYTKTEPTPPALKSTIALVVRKPSVNNMTLLVRPNLNEDLRDLSDVDLNGINNGQTIVWDSINTKWIAGNVGGVIDTSVISTKWYVDSKVDSTRLVNDSILVYYQGGNELRRDTISVPGGGGGGTGTVTSVATGIGLVGGPITTTGTISADTASVLVTKQFLSTIGYLTSEIDGSITNEGMLSIDNSIVDNIGILSNTSTSLPINIVANSGTGQKAFGIIGYDAFLNPTSYAIQLRNDTSTVLATKEYVTSRGYLTSEVDGSVTNEGSLTVGAGTTTTSVINSNTSGSTPVIISASTGLSITESSNTITLTNAAPDQTISITGSGIVSSSGTYPNFTISATEVDGNVSNEGRLSTTSVGTNWGNINTNTSGSSPIAVTVEQGTGQKVAFTTNTNGGGIQLGNDTSVLVTKTFLTNQAYTSNTGTVTSINTGIGLSGGPITSSGTIIADTTVLASKTFVNTRGYLTSEVDGSITNEGVLGAQIINSQSVLLNSNTSTASGVYFVANTGTGINITGINNTNGGQIQYLADTTLLATRAYVNNTTGGGGGTVTSVGLTMPTGFSVSGSPVTSSGTLSVSTSLNGIVRGNGTGFTTGNINLASDVFGILPVLNGGTGASDATTARTNLGASTVGSNFFTATNPSAITFPRVNANNTVTFRSASDFRADIGAGTVSSVALSMPTGLTVAGSPITGSGTLVVSTTLNGVIKGTGSGFTASNVNLASEVTGTLPVANGGTGRNTLTSGAYLRGNGTNIVSLQNGLPSSDLTGTVAIANGGTNSSATPTSGAIAYGTGTSYAFTAAGTAGQVLTSNGAAAPTWQSVSTGGVSSFSAGTTGFTPSTATTGAVTLSGTLNIANGGTGQTTANAAFNALAPAQSGATAGARLMSNGTNTTWAKDTLVMIIALSDETTDLTTGTRVVFRAPHLMNLINVRINVGTAPTGQVMFVDIEENATGTYASIFSTRVSIDANETTSVTAAAPYVFSDTVIADDALVKIDLDQVGSTVAGKGLKLHLYYTK